MKIIGLYILLWFILVSCEKLPPETARGRDIVACKVNGEIFKSKEKKFFLGASFGASAWAGDTLVIIRGSRYHKDDTDELLFLQIRNLASTGIYEIGGVSENYASFQSKEGFSFDRHDSTTGGLLHIKVFDDKIIAGTFEFKAKDMNETVGDITEGRFDIKYKPFER